ncbi:hypothetical protein [Paenibacillus apii]|uniref:hypothetical protein n=1 Tax=Paenibacillus apii TaxID=1850370 RepID=UPI00143A57EC|nr:hypothetical protein [Paenibacillus apii]NJJ39219.1 hypothetical protein [Paenibacillus apii]
MNSVRRVEPAGGEPDGQVAAGEYYTAADHKNPLLFALERGREQQQPPPHFPFMPST